MKLGIGIIAVVLLLLTAMGGMMNLNTTIGQQQDQLIEQQKETDRLAAHVYWTRISLLPLPYRHPLDRSWVSSGTGYRMNPMGGAEESLHKGKDLVAVENAPVHAALSGVVKEHWLTPGMHNGKRYYGDPILGAKIVIDHGDGLFSIYGHLSATYVHEGDWIEIGKPIGRVGNTGITTGPHLHFEIVVDPIKYLEERYARNWRKNYES